MKKKGQVHPVKTVVLGLGTYLMLLPLNLVYGLEFEVCTVERS